jgi:solute:Na+ symporter, SSS family
VVIYVGVLLTAVLYTGATALKILVGIEMGTGVWIIGAIGTLYAATGGLKAIAYADLIQGLALLIGGMIVFFLGLDASGGWAKFSTENADKLKLLLFKGHPGYDELPWHTVFGSMWIVMIYYCGLNQFIVQRNLAAKTLKDGQLGMIFAGALWLLVPFAIVMPGIMAANLFPDRSAEKADGRLPDPDPRVGRARAARLHLRGHRRCDRFHAGLVAQLVLHHRLHRHLSALDQA